MDHELHSTSVIGENPPPIDNHLVNFVAWLIFKKRNALMINLEED